MKPYLFPIILLFALAVRGQRADTIEARRLLKVAHALYYDQTGAFAKGLESARTAKDMFAQALGENAVPVGDAWNLMGKHANYLPNEHSQDYFFNAYRIFKTQLGENHLKTITAKYNADVLYCYQSNYEKCLPLLEEDIERFERLPEAPPQFLAWAYTNYGSFAIDVGDPEKAVIYLNKAAQLYSKTNGPFYSSNAAQLYSYLAIAEEKNGNISDALHLHLKAFQLVQPLVPSTHPTLIDIQGNVAHTYTKLQMPDSALCFLLPAIKNLSKNLGPKHPTLIALYKLKGQIFIQKNQPSLALSAWEKALNIKNAPGNSKFFDLWAPLFLEMAAYYRKHQDFPAALAYCDSVILQSQFDFDHPERQAGNSFSQMLAQALSTKMSVLEEWQCVQDSKPVREMFAEAKKQWDICLQNWKDPRLETAYTPILQREILPRSTEAMLCFEQRNNKIAEESFAKQYHVAQAAKATALLIGFQSGKIRHLYGLPDSLLQKERLLKQKITALGGQIAEKEVAGDSGQVQNLQSEQFEKKRRLDKLQVDIGKKHPRFAAWRSEAPVPNVQTIQDQLLADGKTAIFEYFIGEKYLFIFRILPHQKQSWQIERPANFDSLIVQFRRTISDYSLIKSNPEQCKRIFVEKGHALSALLLREPLAQLPAEITRLIIITDGVLHYIPFEVLLTPQSAIATESVSWNDFPYLIKKYAISYAYSSALLIEQNKAMKGWPAKLFGGFAPKYEAINIPRDDTLATRSLALLVRDGSYNLPGAQREVSAVADLLGGDLFSNEMATESAFCQKASDYAILHLAAHGLMDDYRPALSRLLFTKVATDSLYDNQLTCNEIYGLSLNTELVVLTACNSGNGKLGWGEGALSLGRAFVFAGVRSTIMSLWQSPDVSTEKLMVLFYQNLQKGMNKDAALRQAKLSYLSRIENPESGHPFFWAGCVLFGNTQPIQVSSPPWEHYALAGMSFVLLWVAIRYFLKWRHRQTA